MALAFEELDDPYILHHSRLNQLGSIHFSPALSQDGNRLAGSHRRSIRIYDAMPLPEKP
jgi:hypothetical protein